MELFLLFSLLIIPVVLLASPAPVLVEKGRSDLAMFYLVSLITIQWTIILLYMNTPVAAAKWVTILLSCSQILSIGYLITKNTDWWKMFITILVVNTVTLWSGFRLEAFI